MAFQLSQRAFGQLLRTQSRNLAASSAVRTLSRSAAPAVATCARVDFVKAFSTSRATLNETEQPQESKGPRRERREFVPEPGSVPMNGGRTVFFGNLPFFTDKEAFEKLLEEFGSFRDVKWLNSSKGAPLCHVTFDDPANAAALVDSSAQEPFYYGGRELRVNLAMNRPGYNREDRKPRFPPSARLYFKNFKGDTAALRDFLGPHARYVNNAFFVRDKVTGNVGDAGLITFVDIERATEALNDKRKTVGPDGELVYMRYAGPPLTEKRNEKAIVVEE